MSHPCKGNLISSNLDQSIAITDHNKIFQKGLWGSRHGQPEEWSLCNLMMVARQMGLDCLTPFINLYPSHTAKSKDTKFNFYWHHSLCDLWKYKDSSDPTSVADAIGCHKCHKYNTSATRAMSATDATSATAATSVTAITIECHGCNQLNKVKQNHHSDRKMPVT